MCHLKTVRILIGLVLVCGVAVLYSDAVIACEDAPAIMELRKLGAKLTLNHDGEIVRLSLSDAKLTDKDVAHLSKLTHLKSIDLRGSSLTDDALIHLSNLRQLESLSLCFTKVTDAGMRHLVELTNLRSLELDSTNCTDGSLAQIRKLHNLTRLYVGDTSVTDAGMVYMKDLKNLKSLDVSGTNVTNAGLHHLKELRSLESLGISSTKVTDAGLRVLKGLSCLKELGLSNTQITGNGVKELKDAFPDLLITRSEEVTLLGVNGKATLRFPGLSLSIAFEGISLDHGASAGTVFQLAGEGPSSGRGQVNSVIVSGSYNKGVNTVTMGNHTLLFVNDGAELVVGDQTFMLGKNTAILIDANGHAKKCRRNR